MRKGGYRCGEILKNLDERGEGSVAQAVIFEERPQGRSQKKNKTYFQREEEKKGGHLADEAPFAGQNSGQETGVSLKIRR